MTELALTCTIMGDSETGKTKFIQKFLKKTPTDYAPTVFDRYCILYRFKDYLIELAIQDIGGEKNKSFPIEHLWQNWMYDSDCFVLVYNVGKRTSLEYLQRIINEIKKVKRETSIAPSHSPFIPILFVGLISKDLKREVEISDVKKLALTTLNLKENKECPWMVELSLDDEGAAEAGMKMLLQMAITHMEKHSIQEFTRPSKSFDSKRNLVNGLFTSTCDSEDTAQPPSFRQQK